ncbi:hypothetical protein [Aquibacillus rhizosphaerae]|uniref:DUF4134 domain-containing protein n=1 Tax=Aquibacillus rhizosphaerae TaxID=3051431 RepID=A0ABT7L206_9BACI|nr:hypothetical protein [Aquibacillus sp. LR5S19]MDL4839880.1 hypothetical protein [Aquibacillus sp. LR5S19]
MAEFDNLRVGTGTNLASLAIAILFVDYKDVARISNSGYVTTYTPIYENIVSILRIGIMGMFIGLFIGWKNYRKKNNKTEQKKSYYIEFFIAVFIIALILMFF